MSKAVTGIQGFGLSVSVDMRLHNITDWESDDSVSKVHLDARRRKCRS